MNTSDPNPSFEDIVASIDFEGLEDGDSQTLDSLISVVNALEQVFLHLAPVDLTTAVIDSTRMCYLEPVTSEDLRYHQPSATAEFDMSEYEYLDTMFFRWRGIALIHLWNQLIRLEEGHWIILFQLGALTMVQAARLFLSIINDPENSRRDSATFPTTSSVLESFYDLSPFRTGKQPEVNIKVKSAILLCVQECFDAYSYDDVIPIEVIQKFHDTVHALEQELTAEDFYDITEVFLDLASITTDLLMCGAKEYLFEDDHDHHQFIKGFCSNIREEMVEVHFGDPQ